MKDKCIKCKKALPRRAYYGLHKPCFLEWFGLSEAQEFQNVDPQKSSTSSDHLQVEKKKDTFYHGRYLKYSASLNEISYILKVQEEKCPDLPGMEYLCNRIASLLSLEVPKYYLIIFNKKLTFVTYNFMQDYQISTLHHIYKFLPEGEENHNCSQLIKVIGEQTNQLADVIKFIRICLFDALIGNNDRHGRNLGIIDKKPKPIDHNNPYEPKPIDHINPWRHNPYLGKKLAPMYDNPSYFGIEEESMLEANLNPSCCIWTDSSKEPKFLDYIREFERLGFQKVCREFERNFLNQFQRIEQEVNTALISTKRKKAFLKFLQKKVQDCEQH